LIWAKQIGGVADQVGTTIAVDAAGNIFCAGYFAGTADFDPGPGVFNLVNPSNSVTDVFICKLDANGNFGWAKQIVCTGDDKCSDLSLDATGNLYITGYFTGTADFDPGPGTATLVSVANDIFICKFDGNGNFSWAKQLGGPENDSGGKVLISPGGTIYCVGGFKGSADFDPGPGVFTLVSDGDIDGYICQLNSLGDLIWAKQIRGTGKDVCRTIKLDGAGNIYVGGSFTGTTDFDPSAAGIFNYTSFGLEDAFICKLTPTGDFTWVKQFGSIGFEIVYDVVLSSTGYVTTCGIFSSTVDFDPGPGVFNLTAPTNYHSFISTLDGNGNFASAVQLSGNTISVPVAIHYDPLSSINFYVGGSFENTVDFDPGPGMANLTAIGIDGFILKLANVVTAVNPDPSVPTIKVYPNPANSVLTVELKGKFDYTVFDNNGKAILMKRGLYDKITIQIVRLPKGTYILEIASKNHLQHYIFIVQ
jgi:hypothetical protein